MFSSLGKVYSRHATDSVNCETSSVSSVMKYCPTSTVVRNPASVQILITRFCCESLYIRSWNFCNRSSCAGSSVEGRCFHHACDLRAPHRLTRPAFEAHPGAITFPPEADSLWSHFSTGPSASRNTFSVSTITDGNARIGGRSIFLALTRA